MTDPGMIHPEDQRGSPDGRAAGERDVPVEEGGHGGKVGGYEIESDRGGADASRQYPTRAPSIDPHIPQQPTHREDREKAQKAGQRTRQEKEKKTEAGPRISTPFVLRFKAAPQEENPGAERHHHPQGVSLGEDPIPRHAPSLEKLFHRQNVKHEAEQAIALEEKAVHAPGLAVDRRPQMKRPENKAQDRADLGESHEKSQLLFEGVTDREIKAGKRRGNQRHAPSGGQSLGVRPADRKQSDGQEQQKRPPSKEKTPKPASFYDQEKQYEQI